MRKFRYKISYGEAYTYAENGRVLDGYINELLNRMHARIEVLKIEVLPVEEAVIPEEAQPDAVDPQ